MATSKTAKQSSAMPRVEKGIYKRGPFSYQVKIMAHGHVLTQTFDSLEEARAYRDSKKASHALDPDLKRVLDSRVAKTTIKAMSLSKALT